MWITNGNIADLAVVWAKDESSAVRGFLVSTDTPGFEAHPVPRKMSLRASDTAELVLQDVRVPASMALPEATGLHAALSLPDPGKVWDRVGCSGRPRGRV